MPRYHVRGAQRATGEDASMTLEASSRDAAERKAIAQGLLVSDVTAAMPDSLPPRSGVAHTPANREPEVFELRAGNQSLIRLDGKPTWFVAILALLAVCLTLIWVLNNNDDDHAPRTGAATSSAPSTSRGIGWSVAQVEHNWAAEHGWHWVEKSRSETVGIRWRAACTNVPWLGLTVEGPPDDLLAAQITVVLDDFDADVFYARAAAGALIAVEFARASSAEETEIIEWIAERFMAWLEDPEPAMIDAGVASTGHVITIECGIHDETTPFVQYYVARDQD